MGTSKKTIEHRLLKLKNGEKTMNLSEEIQKFGEILEKFDLSVNKLKKLRDLEAPLIICSSEVRKLSNLIEEYEVWSEEQDRLENNMQTNGDKYEKDSDDEHYAYVQFCIESRPGSKAPSLKEWRTFSA